MERRCVCGNMLYVRFSDFIGLQTTKTAEEAQPLDSPDSFPIKGWVWTQH